MHDRNWADCRLTGCDREIRKAVVPLLLAGVRLD